MPINRLDFLSSLKSFKRCCQICFTVIEYFFYILLYLFLWLKKRLWVWKCILIAVVSKCFKWKISCRFNNVCLHNLCWFIISIMFMISNSLNQAHFISVTCMSDLDWLLISSTFNFWDDRANGILELNKYNEILTTMKFCVTNSIFWLFLYLLLVWITSLYYLGTW